MVILNFVLTDRERKDIMDSIFRRNWRKATTAGGENSGESRKGAEGARLETAESLRQKDGDILKN